MARHKRGGKNWRGGRQKRSKEEWEEMKRQNPDLAKKSEYTLAPKTNSSFEKFYSGIGIVPEEEWELFLETMRKPLPTTFRITGSRNQAQELLKIIKGKYFSKFVSGSDGTPKLDPQPLPWYPDELAWQIDFTKKQIKNDNTLKSLHGFLISETESGNISRQEAVSMLPPLLLEVEPHHKILDMCAAPGSKTAQLIEMLHNDENVPIPEGYVVANDMDNKRCYLMTHQVKRIQSPNCMIINHDARVLPNMVTSKDENAQFVKYDRILCDVPCSGDGTMRKNPDIWSKWNVNGAHNLHRIQKKVLQRGLELLSVGGRLVYSTCSLNPIEDEAVILAMIKQCEGAVELIDVSDKLCGLKYSKGTYSWKVLSKSGDWYETVAQAPELFNNLWDCTIYPPIITEAQEAKLERCIRVLPHQQNTGAFFIAVLQKIKELPWASTNINRSKLVVKDPGMKKDEADKKKAGSEHFSFNVRSGRGTFKYARCNLCDVLLQGRNDYDSHRQGRKHQQNLLLLKAQEGSKESESKPVSEGDIKPEAATDTANTVNVQSDTVADAKEKLIKQETGEKMETVNSDIETVDNGSETVDEVKTVNDSDNIESKKVNVEQTDNGSSDAVGSETEKKTLNGSSEDEKAETTITADKVTKVGDNTSDEPAAKKARLACNDDEEIRVVFSGHREDPFYFCSKNDPIWPSIKDFYGISDDFCIEQVMYRNMKRVLYYVSKPIRNLVICNDDRVKFINLGVKCFSNALSPLVPDCDFRLSQEGLLAIQKHITGRRVTLTKQDVITILSQENPFICKLSADTQVEVYALDPGSCLFHFKPSESDPEPNVEIVFCGWRGKTSVRSFVSKDERSHYLRICGVELSDIQAQVMEKKAIRDSEAIVPSQSGTETPVGVASGDEEELEQWNKVTEAPRGHEVDELEDSLLSVSKSLETDNVETVSDTALSDGLKQEMETS